MARKASKLAAMLRSEGWKPGKDIKETRTFEHVSEACGCDLMGHSIAGAKHELHIGDDADGYTIRDLYANLVVSKADGQPVGTTFIQEYMDPRNQRSLWEAGGAIDAVDSSAFMGITGQLMVTEVLKPYEKEEYIVRKLIPTYPSPLEQERWIGIAPPSDPGKNILRVAEKEPFRTAGLHEQYVQSPITRKEGLIIGLTKEAIFFDRTGDLVNQAAEVGDLIAFSEEQECIGCVIGGTTDPTYFVEKRAIDSAPVTLDLFQAAGAGSGAYQLAYAHSTRAYPFVNEVPDNPLVDYTSVRLCDQYFSNIVDPNRGRPIVVGQPFILAPHTKRMDIMQLIYAENIMKLSKQGMTTAGALLTNSPNVLNTIGLTIDQVRTSRLLKSEMVAQLGLTAAQADLVWFYGDIGRAFRYVSNWPLTVTQAPVNSEAEFNQDIVARWKASKRGRCAVFEPRCWLRCNYASQSSGA
jgi:hypothetical protein